MSLMFKIVSKILHSLILLVVGAALVGINVNKLYCTQCEEVYLQVKMIPQEDACPCEHGCSCCDKETEKKSPCRETDSKSSFYKIADSSQTERAVTFDIVFCPFEKSVFLAPVLRLPESVFFSYRDEFSGLFPSPERLCTYRC